MPEKKLLQALNTLQQEINGLANVDAAARGRLHDLVSQVQSQIDDPENADRPAALSALNSAVAQFELSHPNLTAVINDVMRILSDIGI